MPFFALPVLLLLADTPEATIAAFVKAFNDNDAAALAREIEGGVVSPSPLNPSRVVVKANVLKTTVAGEDAYLEVEVEATGLGLPEAGKGQETIHLRLRDGNWRVVPSSVMTTISSLR